MDDSAARSVDNRSSSAASPNPMDAASHPHYVNPLAAYFPTIIGPPPCPYRLRARIGRGSYSTVWSLVNNQTEEVVVGKLSGLDPISDSTRRFLISEAQNIRTCSHPNILRLYDAYESGQQFLYILEFADAGDLLGQVDARASAPGQPAFFRLKEALMIFTQACLAIQYLHQRRIMHRDLKTANLMVLKCGLIKLGDFGFSRQYETSISADVGTTLLGTPFYLAPELWQRQAYSLKADIWSLGVIFYEILALRKPFNGSDVPQLMSQVLTPGSYEALPPGQYPDELYNIVYSMLSVNPAERPTIQQILATPYMRENGLLVLSNQIRRLKGIDPDTLAYILTDIDETLKASTGSRTE